MKSLPYVRKKEILEMLKRTDYLDTNQLSEKFGVSYMTIHRDLKVLENEGRISRVHGGAIVFSSGENADGTQAPVSEDLTMEERFCVCQQEKRAMAKAAAKMVKDGEIIALDASTSALQMCSLLHDREITVVTNGLNIALQFADSESVEVLLIGGLLRKSSLSLSEICNPELLDTLNIDKCFFSASALSFQKGMTELSYEESKVKRKILGRVDKLFVLADHTKIGKSAPYVDCTYEQIHAVVTDQFEGASVGQIACLQDFEKHGVQVIYGIA